MKKAVLILMVNVFVVGLAACTTITDETSAIVEETAAATHDAVPSAPAVEPATTNEPTNTEEPAAVACPEATDSTYLLRDPRHGFCLLYPVTHKVERPNPQEVILVVGGLLNAGAPGRPARPIAAL